MGYSKLRESEMERCEMTIGNESYYTCDRIAKYKIPDTKVQRGLYLCGTHKNVFERQQIKWGTNKKCEKLF